MYIPVTKLEAESWSGRDGYGGNRIRLREVVPETEKVR